MKYVHVTLGIFLLGATIATLFFMKSSRWQYPFLHAINRAALIIDCVWLPLLIMLFFTGTRLVYTQHLSLQVPWVHAAYALLGVTSVCWAINCGIKIINYRSFVRDPRSHFRYRKLFQILSCVMIISMIAIIHDAVTRSTLLAWGHGVLHY